MAAEPQESSPTSPRDHFDQASEKVRRISPALFGIVVIAFLLPFLSVVCAGKDVVTISGTDFVTGAKVEVDPEFEEAMSFGDDFETEGSSAEEDLAEDDRVERNIWIIIAVAAAIAGLVTTLLMRGSTRTKAAALAASVGAASLLVFRFDASSDTGGIPGAIEIKYRFGYWIALLGSLVLAASFVAAWLRERSILGERPPDPAPPPSIP